jgi:long-chain fatty acid transport protein
MKLKKLSLLLLANLVGLSLMAEGYQINSQSARQVGMGHLGTALKLGSESMLFNPAGLSFMQGKYEVSLGATAIFSKVKYMNDSYSVDTDNPIGTPLFGYVGLKLSDKLFAGVSITNPVGNTLVWPDNWVGAHHIQNISLKAFSIQPTLSYKINDKLSIGAGLMVDFGSFTIEKALTRMGALNALGGLNPAFKTVLDMYANQPSVTAKLEGESKISMGFNAGILYTPNDKLSIGISYRSKVMMEVNDGMTTVSYAGPEMLNMITTVNTMMPGAVPIPPIDGKNFSASLPIPSNLNVGIAYKTSEKLLLSAEVQYVGWKAYDKLTIGYGSDAGNLQLVSNKNFKNSMIYRIGGELTICEKMTWRFGAIYDTTPVDKMLYSPETPGANKFSATTGFSYSPMDMLTIDLGFQALVGQKVRGYVPETWNPTVNFVGDYRATALIPSLGVKLNF